MSSRRTEFAILCEDQKSRDFLARYLKRRLRVSEHQIRRLPVPNGDGCGSQYVLQEYPGRLRLLRMSVPSKALLVMIDADNHAVDERLDELAASVAAQGLAKRQSGEPVALLVPKRNIETWLRHLRTSPPDPVDETKVYSESESKRHREYWAPAADQLAELLAQGFLWPDCPPSLAAALPEFARVP